MAGQSVVARVWRVAGGGVGWRVRSASVGVWGCGYGCGCVPHANACTNTCTPAHTLTPTCFHTALSFTHTRMLSLPPPLSPSHTRLACADKSKYGLPGTDGTWWSNYKVYVCNNHQLLALCCSHPLNPIPSEVRWLILWCSWSWALTVALLIEVARGRYEDRVSDFSATVITSLVASLLVTPADVILEAIGTCELCERKNCCVGR